MAETLLIKSDLERFDGWTNAFKDCDVKVVDWNEDYDPNEIDYALAWEPGVGTLARFPNLKIIFSLGAGLDHLKADGVLPPNLPVVRMVEDGLTAGMVEYIVYAVLRFHRFMPQYERDKQNKIWDEIVQIEANKRTVGILGLGVLGGSSAQALMSLGFNVIGWSRSKKDIEGVKSYFGDEQLDDVLNQSEFLVSLLPLTDQTRGILNRTTLGKLPQGAFLINAGRGASQVEQDIIDLLDSGHLAGAALDVYEEEPPPKDSAIWTHPGIYFTPHIASMVYPDTSAVHVYDNIVRYRNGEPLTHVADIVLGY